MRLALPVSFFYACAPPYPQRGLLERTAAVSKAYIPM